MLCTVYRTENEQGSGGDRQIERQTQNVTENTPPNLQGPTKAAQNDFHGES